MKPILYFSEAVSGRRTYHFVWIGPAIPKAAEVSAKSSWTPRAHCQLCRYRNRALNGTKWATSLAKEKCLSFVNRHKNGGNVKASWTPQAKAETKFLQPALPVCKKQRHAATSLPRSSAIGVLGWVCFVLLTVTTCLTSTKHLETQHTNGRWTRYCIERITKISITSSKSSE